MSWGLLGVGAAGLVLLSLIIYSARRKHNFDRAYFKKRWQKIVESYKVEDTGTSIAVIEADKLFDKALKNAGFNGGTAGERLKSASKSLKHANAVWQAHKLRNEIVHNPDFKLKKNEAKHAIRSFYRALRELGAL